MTAVEMITSEIDEKLAIVRKPRMQSIVIATDGSESALAAFNVADLIHARNGAEIHVLSVLEPIPPMTIIFPPQERMMLPEDFARAREDGRRKGVRDAELAVNATHSILA